MDAAAELGRNPVSKLSMKMSRLMRAGTAEPVSRDQILRHERGQGDIHFPVQVDHEQDWQPYPVDPYPYYMCDILCTTLFLVGFGSGMYYLMFLFVKVFLLVSLHGD